MFGLALILLGVSTACIAFDKKITLQTLGTCSEFQIESGYGYRDSFPMSNMENNKAEENENFRIRIFAQTTNDAHILLSSTKWPQFDDKAYEIVLGGWGNTDSVIRRKKQSNEYCGRQAAPLLSPLYPTEIEVRQTKDGVLSVHIPGFTEAFMKCNDEDPVDVKYLSFSSWGDNAPARWFYDCRFDYDIPLLDVRYRDTVCINTKTFASASRE